MTKAQNGHSSHEPVAHTDQAEHAPMTSPLDDATDSSVLISTVATVGVVGIGIALFEAALIPGMIIGVAAAIAPTVAPKLSAGMEPLFRSTVRGAYKLTRRARHAVAEARESVEDIVAEVKSEAAPASPLSAP